MRGFWIGCRPALETRSSEIGSFDCPFEPIQTARFSKSAECASVVGCNTMTSPSFSLFETAIGPCGIAWSELAIYCTQLPEGDETRSRARMQKRVPGAREAGAPAHVQTAIARIVALLAGGKDDDLSDLALDMARLPD